MTTSIRFPIQLLFPGISYASKIDYTKSAGFLQGIPKNFPENF